MFSCVTPKAYIFSESDPTFRDYGNKIVYIHMEKNPTIEQKRIKQSLKISLDKKGLSITDKNVCDVVLQFQTDVKSGTLSGTRAVLIPNRKSVDGKFGGINYTESTTEWKTEIVPYSKDYQFKYLFVDLYSCHAIDSSGSLPLLWRSHICLTDKADFVNKLQLISDTLVSYLGEDLSKEVDLKLIPIESENPKEKKKEENKDEMRQILDNLDF